jgi:hypothetical protein
VSFSSGSTKNLTESQLNALTANPDNPVTYRKITADVYQYFTHDHSNRFEGGQRLLFRAGQVVKQSEIDALFADATIDTVTPATGPAAGGTAVTIRGTNFGGATAVAFGGTAATNVKVVDETTITCTTAAKTAGATNLTITDDSGTATKASPAFTYV